jgi:hypothetical protein
MIPTVDLSDIVVKNSEAINPSYGWHWHGRITIQDIYITSMVKKIGLIATIAITAMGCFFGGIPTAGAIFAGGIITSLFLRVLAEKVERVSWTNELCNSYNTGEKRYTAPSINNNVVIDNEKNIVSIHLTPQDLTKEQNIFFRENQLKEEICLVKILKTEDLGTSLGGTISLNICHSKYENRTFNVKVGNREIPVDERIIVDGVR